MKQKHLLTKQIGTSVCSFMPQKWLFSLLTLLMTIVGSGKVMAADVEVWPTLDFATIAFSTAAEKPYTLTEVNKETGFRIDSSNKPNIGNISVPNISGISEKVFVQEPTNWQLNNDGLKNNVNNAERWVVIKDCKVGQNLVVNTTYGSTLSDARNVSGTNGYYIVTANGFVAFKLSRNGIITSIALYNPEVTINFSTEGGATNNRFNIINTSNGNAQVLSGSTVHVGDVLKVTSDDYSDGKYLKEFLINDVSRTSEIPTPSVAIWQKEISFDHTVTGSTTIKAVYVPCFTVDVQGLESGASVVWKADGFADNLNGNSGMREGTTVKVSVAPPTKKVLDHWTLKLKNGSTEVYTNDNFGSKQNPLNLTMNYSQFGSNVGYNFILTPVFVNDYNDAIIGPNEKNTAWTGGAGQGKTSNIYRLTKGNEYTFEFDCHQSSNTEDRNEWNSWVVMACNGSLNDTKFILRTDGVVYDKDNDKNGNITWQDGYRDNRTVALKDGAIDWEQFKSDLDGAHAKVKVSYDGEKVFVYQVITNNGRTYTYYYPYDYVGTSIELYIGVDCTQLTNFTANSVQALKIVTKVENTSGVEHPEMGNVVVTNDEGVTILEGSIVGRGTSIHLTATANPNYLFDHWSGGDTPQVSLRDFVVGSNSDATQHTFHAYFASLDQYTQKWTLEKNVTSLYIKDNEGKLVAWNVTKNGEIVNGARTPDVTTFSAAYDAEGNENAGTAGILFNNQVAKYISKPTAITLYKNGGAMKVPVEEGHVVTVEGKAWSGSSNSLTIQFLDASGNVVGYSPNLVTNNSNATSTRFYIPSGVTHVLLTNTAKNDIDITALSKSFVYDFTFADGDNVAATPGTTKYVNEIVGLPDLPLLDGATYVWTSSNPAEVQVNSSTGQITVNESFSGDVTITATRLKMGNNPAIAKRYTLSSTTNVLHHDNEEIHAQVELDESGTAIFDVPAYWKNQDDPYIVGKDIKYTIIDSTAKDAKPTPDEEGRGTNEIAIDGKGTTKVMASCGAISCLFYIDTFGFVFDETSIVHDFASNNYTQVVTGATSYSMEKIGAISTKDDCVINASTGEISGLPSYEANLGGAIVVKTTKEPVNVTTANITNASFDENITDWTIDITNNNASGGGYQTNHVYYELNKFIEAWNNTSLADGQIYSSLSNVPAGKYILKVDAIAVNQVQGYATNVYLFAQEGTSEWQKVSISTEDNVSHNFELNFTKIKEDTNLKIGIATRAGDGTVNANWIAADNFTLLQKKDASYVLTIPYKKYSWNFYNEGEDAEITTAQVLKDNHFTMGDLTANGNPHAASEVTPVSSVILPNSGDTYPGKYVVDEIYNSVDPVTFATQNPTATNVQKDTNSKNYGHKQAILRELTWQAVQNGDISNQQTDNDAHKYWNYSFKTRQHKSRTSTEPLDYLNEPLFSYKNKVNGNNVRIVKDTQGLIFDTGANSFGINDRYNSADVYNGSGELTETAISVREQDRAILIYKDASFTIPFVKQGDYVKLHWYRHADKAGDLFSVTNACDMDDVAIDPTHSIRMTGSHYQGTKGTTGRYRGYTIVRAKEDGPIKFTAKANSWMEIYTIELTDVYDTELRVISSVVGEDIQHPTDGWGGPMCSETTGKDLQSDIINIVRDANSTTSYNRSTLSVREKLDKELENDGDCATTPSNQFGDNPLIYIASYSGATFGWNGWNLDVECNPVPEDAGKLSIGCKEALMTRIGNNTSYGVYALTNFKGTGTAHVIVRTKSQGVDGSPRYTLDKQEAYFPVGEYQSQSYPYTWDFTEYNIQGTKTGDTNGIQYRNISKSRESSYGGWSTNNLKTYAEVSATIQSQRNQTKYNKFLFANGSQLTMNQSDNTGATYIRETEGLRVELNNMVKNHSYASSNLVMDGDKLAVNGTITIPNVTAGMYVFVQASDNVTMSNTNDIAAGSIYPYAGEADKVVTGKIAATTGDITITIPAGVSISRIGVTDQIKTLNKWGYATESRIIDIDHNETKNFSANVSAYYVGSYDKNGSTVTESYVGEGKYVPKFTGTMLKMTKTGKNENVPLFVPAVNIPSDETSGNYLLPTTQSLEVQNATIPKHSVSGQVYTYTLTNVYGMLASSDSQELVGGLKEHGEDEIAFYKFVGTTIGANKAYLQLPAGAKNVKSILFITDEDFEDITPVETIESDIIDSEMNTEYYTLSGVKLKSVPSVSGIYIKNGKKVYVK